jgi:hypothetical protein
MSRPMGATESPGPGGNLWLVVGRLDDSEIERASLFEHCDQVTEVLVAGCGIEVSVLAHELLERVEELEAPSHAGGAGDALARDVDIHRRAMREYRLVERVGMTTTAGHGRDPRGPPAPAAGRRGETGWS